MRSHCLALLAPVTALVVIAACGKPEDELLALMSRPEVRERGTRLEQALTQPNPAESDSTPIARWTLPVQLREVSGLTLTADDHLLAHGDEDGLIAEIDYRRGVVTKQFGLKGNVSDDFEGITIANEAIYMVTSKGLLYEFREGERDQRVEYILHDTELGKECEFEGVAFDPGTQSLLLACKNVLNEAMQDSLVIFRWKLGDSIPTASRITHLAIPLALVTASVQEEKMRPSDIAVDPITGNYVMVSAQERTVLEITPAGQVVQARKISQLHEQAEGIAVTPDSLLIISDEAVRANASITLYRRK